MTSSSNNYASRHASISSNSAIQFRAGSISSLELPTNHSIDANGRMISYSKVKEYTGDNSSVCSSDSNHSSECYDINRDDDERLASLEALRYALHHAPFSRNLHTLMTVPDEQYYEQLGIPTKCAIRVENLCYKNLLDQINIEVPKGKIYALLGAANNGKSTLLKLIVGRLKPTSGKVTTFGSCPAKCPLSAICVGYMPQEVTLHEELTICQTLAHYGRLYQLPLYLIMERIQILCSMLHLPNQCRLVRDLNQGQKWRLSLAVALIHSPPLLLLDEPTVNVDPLIRSSIWSRLERLCTEEDLTILITTKYPEEIGYAYKVGLMRNGHVYEEDQPKKLRQRYGVQTYDELYTKFCENNFPRRVRPSIAPYLHFTTPTNCNDSNNNSNNSNNNGGSSTNNSSKKVSFGAEPHSNHNQYPLLDRLRRCSSDAFLSSESFCKQQSSSKTGPSYSSNSSSYDSDECIRWPYPMAEWPICERRRTAYLSKFVKLDWIRVLALVTKNFLVIRGNLIQILIFYFLFPVLQIVFVCVIFGRTIQRLPVSIPADVALHDNFGPTFVHSFLDQKTFMPIYVENLQTSIDQVRQGQAWAAIVPWTLTVPKHIMLNQSSPSQYANVRQQFNCDFDLEQDESNAIDSVVVSPANEMQSLTDKSLTAGDSRSQPLPYGIQLYLDHSNYVIAQQMFYSFINSMRNFLRSKASRNIERFVWNRCYPTSVLIGDNNNDKSNKTDKTNKRIKLSQSQSQQQHKVFQYAAGGLNHTAIDIKEVIYGSTTFRFLEFLLPGFLVAIVFTYSLVLTAYLFVKEYMAGLQERCLTTGASGIEILASHYLSQTGLYLLQQTVILIVVFRLFGLPSKGPFYLLWLIIFLQGFVGISFGIFAAIICPRPMGASLFVSAISIPAFFFSGIVWPIESMHRLTQYLSHIMPLTRPINSLRYIISRGPDIHYSQIFVGFSVSFVYIAALLLLTVIIFKYRTSS